MKKAIFTILSLFLLLFLLSGCGNLSPDVAFNISEDQLQSICELATMECFYNNVAKSKVKHGLGSTTEFWCEYTGVVKVGIDFSKLKLETNGEELIISLPEAKVLEIKVNKFDQEKILIADTNITSSKVTPEDISAAFSKAQADMKQAAKDNATVLMSARNNAKIIIENYINRMDEIAGTHHTIKWLYNDPTSSSTVPSSVSSGVDLTTTS